MCSEQWHPLGALTCGWELSVLPKKKKKNKQKINNNKKVEIGQKEKKTIPPQSSS